MLLDSRDILILRLAGRYRWLPYEPLCRPEFADLLGEINVLIKTGYLGLSQKKRYLKLSPQGYNTLKSRGFNYDPGSKRAFAGSSSLRRRLETASIMLTALRAGIDVSSDNVDALSGQPVFYPAFDLRDGEMNLMNAASCAGFGHWGSAAYMLQYVSPQSCGMYLTNELRHLHNLSPLFDLKLNTPLAMIFAGQSYGEVYDLLCDKARSTRHGKKGFVDFADVYRNTDMPIHLLSCDETGAMQLALMRQLDYNARLARAAFGVNWKPGGDAYPEADGCVGAARPIVIAADMDLRRVERVLARARQNNAKEVYIAAFRGQWEQILTRLFPKDGILTHLCIEQTALNLAFGEDFSLNSMNPTEGSVYNG